MIIPLATRSFLVYLMASSGSGIKSTVSPHAACAARQRLFREFNPLKTENVLLGTGAPVLPADLLTVQQLAKRLHVSVAWVYDKTKKGSLHPIPFLRVGHFVRFDWVAVCEWMRRKAA